MYKRTRMFKEGNDTHTGEPNCDAGDHSECAIKSPPLMAEEEVKAPERVWVDKEIVGSSSAACHSTKVMPDDIQYVRANPVDVEGLARQIYDWASNMFAMPVDEDKAIAHLTSIITSVFTVGEKNQAADSGK